MSAGESAPSPYLPLPLHYQHLRGDMNWNHKYCEFTDSEQENHQDFHLASSHLQKCRSSHAFVVDRGDSTMSSCSGVSEGPANLTQAKRNSRIPAHFFVLQGYLAAKSMRGPERPLHTTLSFLHFVLVGKCYLVCESAILIEIGCWNAIIVR